MDCSACPARKSPGPAGGVFLPDLAVFCQFSVIVKINVESVRALVVLQTYPPAPLCGHGVVPVVVREGQRLALPVGVAAPKIALAFADGPLPGVKIASPVGIEKPAHLEEEHGHPPRGRPPVGVVVVPGVDPPDLHAPRARDCHGIFEDVRLPLRVRRAGVPRVPRIGVDPVRAGALTEPPGAVFRVVVHQCQGPGGCGVFPPNDVALVSAVGGDGGGEALRVQMVIAGKKCRVAVGPRLVAARYDLGLPAGFVGVVTPEVLVGHHPVLRAVDQEVGGPGGGRGGDVAASV
mmetsp:Transcript_9293/g.20548  ORF Transcript_9293/g.20548 Transcript_9293/m.20548 type:complete len:291 (-) Transcript_9293:779-1651(-)